MAQEKKTRQQLELRKIIGSTKWDLFVTLTFRNKMTEDQISKSLKMFFISVERSCFGRQKEKRVCRLPTIEHSSEASHVHLLVKKPDNYTHAKFKDLLINKWKKVRNSGASNLQKRMKSQGKSWYEVIAESNDDRRKVADYITKYVPDDYSTVDFENTITTGS